MTSSQASLAEAGAPEVQAVDVGFANDHSPAARGTKKSSATRHPAPARTRSWLVAFSMLSATILMQWLNGSYVSEFGSRSDDAAHYVTGLLVHDYLLSADWAHPLRFAENFYAHYPKVAIGHWGPVFYLVQAFWGLALGTSRLSMMLLMASTTTVLAVTLYKLCTTIMSHSAAMLMSLLLVGSHTLQISTASLMTEPLSALLCFWAVIAWSRFLAQPSWRPAMAFGLLASAAILTKANGLLLAIVPLISVLVSRKWTLLVRPTFWLAAMLVVLLCGPWYALTFKMQSVGGFDAGFMVRAIPYYTHGTLRLVGLPALLLAVVGSAHPWGAARQSDLRGVNRAVMLALLTAVVLFHWVVPCGYDTRHLSVAVAPFLYLAAEGASQTGSLLRRLGSSTLGVTLVSGLALAGGAYDAGLGGMRPWFGFGKVIEDLNLEPLLRDAVLLVSSDEDGDGMFVSEVAMRDQRPHWYALRASKVLATSQWKREEHQLRFQSLKELETWLDETPVGLVVIDRSADNQATLEHSQLKEIVRAYPDDWKLWRTYPIVRRGVKYPNAIEVYQHVGFESQPLRHLEMDMRHMLGRPIVVDSVRERLSEVNGHQ